MPNGTTINGTAGGDTLAGGDGSDTIFGLAGDDILFGHSSGDISAAAGWIDAIRVATGLSALVGGAAAPGDADALYLIEKNAGRIARLDLATGTATTFLDMPDAELGAAGEEGLLGLAFHPQYAANGRFFVHRVNSAGDIEIREYARSAGVPPQADPASGRAILTVPHPTITAAGSASARTASSSSRSATAEAAAIRSAMRRTSTACSASCSGSMSTATTSRRTRRAITLSPPTTRSWAWPARTRSGPGACAIPGGRASIR
jgi:hypothetical protein